MALNNLNKMGLDNVPTNNLLGGPGQTPVSTSSINLTSPTTSMLQPSNLDAFGVRLNNNRLNTVTPIIDTYENETLNNLASQVGTQEARVAAAAGPEMLAKQEEEQDEKGILETIFDILDAPRNAIFNAVKYVAEDNVDGFFKGFARGWTHEEEYSGYDMVADVFGVEEGPGNAILGFTAEVLLDPINWLTWGGSSLIKGFTQGATKNVAKEIAEQGLQKGAKQLGEQAAREGAEEFGEKIVSSGIEQTGRTIARNGIQETINESAEQATKQVTTGAGGIINRLKNEADTIAEVNGLQFGPAKTQAVYDEALKIVKGTGKLSGGLTDDVLNLARAGTFGDDIGRQADELVNLKSMVAATGKSTDMMAEIAKKQDELLKALYPHQVDLRIEALAAKGVDSASLKSRLAGLYEEQMTGSLIGLKNKYNVQTVNELTEALSKEAGRELSEGDVLLKLAEDAFTKDILGQIPEIYLKTKSPLAIKDSILTALMDNVAADDLAKTVLKKGTQAMGKGFGLEVPFTRVGKEIVSAKRLYEIGAQARTLLSNKVIVQDGVEMVVQRGGIVGLLGKGVDLVDDTIGRTIAQLFGRTPIIASVIESGGKVVDAPLDKAHAWAAKLIKQNTANLTKLGHLSSEAKLEDYFKVLKAAGFKEAEDVGQVGEFMQRAIESGTLLKTGTLDDWADTIKGFKELDDATIEKLAKDKVAEARKVLELSEEAADLSFIKQTVNQDGTFVNAIDEASSSYKQWYEDTLNAYRNEFKNQSEIKKTFLSFNEKKQRAMLETTKMMAEDFDAIGKELAKYGMIPEERLLNPEYWYFPHKLNMDLLLQKDFDLNRRIIGGRTEKFNMINASSFKRQYPMSAVEVNKILEKKYGVPNMLETNAFYTYILYSMDQSKILAEAKETKDILDLFGTRLLNDRYSAELMSKGQDIIIRKNSAKGYLVPEKTIKTIEEYKRLTPAIKKQMAQMDKLYTRATTLQGRLTGTNVMKNALNAEEALKVYSKETRELMSQIDDLAKRGSEVINRVLNNRGIKATGLDEDTFYHILLEDMNSMWIKGKNYYISDIQGNIISPSTFAATAFKDEKGLQTFIGNADDIGAGFRQVSKIPSIMPEGYKVCYLNIANPAEIRVPNIPEGIDGIRNLVSKADIDTYLNQGYDGLRLVDSTGATAVLPFFDEQVYLRYTMQQADRAGALNYANSLVNTIDNKAGTFTNPFIPNDTVMYVKDIPQGYRSTVAKVLKERMDTSDIRLLELDRSIDTLANKDLPAVKENLAKVREKIDKLEYEGVASDSSTLLKLRAQEENLVARVSNINANITKNTLDRNNIVNNNTYKFVKELRRSTKYGTGNVITTSEFYNLLGNRAPEVLRGMGYDAILDHTTSEGKNLYIALTDKVVDKKDLMLHYKNAKKIIEEDEGLEALYMMLTDIGEGRDPLAILAQNIADKELLTSIRTLSKDMDKISNIDIGKYIDSADFKNMPNIKQLSNDELNILAKISRAEGEFYKFTNEKDIRVMANLMRHPAFVAISNRGFDMYAMPSGIVDYFNKLTVKQTDAGAAAIRELMYKFNKIWKPSVTAWRPSFGVRNLMSGYFNSFMYAGRHIFDLDIQKAAFNLAAGRNLDEVITLGNFKGTLKELNEQMVKTGATNGFVNADLSSINEMIVRNIKGLSEDTGSKVAKVARHPLQSIQKMNSGIEDYNRALLYMAAIKNGETFEYAGDLVKKLQFDYADLTDFEKKIKNVLPFYTWLRNNLPLQIEHFLDDPAFYTMLMRRVPEFTKEMSGMSDEDYDNLPDWIKDVFPMILGKDEETGRYRLFDTTLPYQDLALLNSTPKEYFGEVVSMLHPLIKTPAELFLNRNLYTNAALESYEGEVAEQAIKGQANPVLNAIGMVAPNALRSMPGITVTANQILNTFGTTRDFKYFNQTQGTAKEGSTVYGSKEVSHTSSNLLNLIENALIDTNQLKYYSPELGQKEALYQKQRDLSNLIQKLEDQGYNVPSSSEIKKITGNSSTGTQYNSKGQAMVANTFYDKEVLDNFRKVTPIDAPRSNLDIIRNSLIADGYFGVDSKTNNNYTLDEDMQVYKMTFEKWKAMKPDERPKAWYDLLPENIKYDPLVYNQMVVYNFSGDKLAKWFANNNVEITIKSKTAKSRQN